ncbi:MAG TPA: hypothetical protein VGR96_00610 [Acidobacteriaceae bacterium]|nr:hypothetical protein [Acidobacteriaceae bacterium]
MVVEGFPLITSMRTIRKQPMPVQQDDPHPTALAWANGLKHKFVKRRI